MHLIQIMLARLRFVARSREMITMTISLGLMIVLSLAHAWWFVSFEPNRTLGDALWLSFITITTIGYGDISATTTLARIGTVVFAFLGLVVFAVLISSMAALVINHFQDLAELKRKGFKMLKCRNHILIINW